MAERNSSLLSVNIQCLENPPPELKLDNKTGLIQIKVRKLLSDNSVLSIHEDSPQYTCDKIDFFCLFSDNVSRIWRMFHDLQVPRGEYSDDACTWISKYVARTAKRVNGGSADMKRFLVYVDLQVEVEDVDDAAENAGVTVVQ